MQPVRVFLAALFLALTPAARADLTLQAPDTARPGEAVVLTLVLLNTSNEAVSHTPPAVLPVVIQTRSGPQSVVFRPEPQTVFEAAVQPGGFRRTAYHGVIPGNADGLVVFDASLQGAGRVAVDVRTPPPGVRVAATAAPTVSTDAPPDGPPPSPAPRSLGFSPYEPLYFSFGANGHNVARFQISFKFRPVGMTDDRVAGAGFWEDLYLSYTQTSLWDLGAESKPFQDSSYRPALFWYRYDLGRVLGGRLSLASGFEHESNGKGGADSRSINIAFARPTLTWGRDDDWQFSASPKVYTYLDKVENPDIQRYRGYGDFRVGVAHPRGWDVNGTLRFGTSGKTSVLLNASYPFSRINDLFPLGWVHGYLHFQYFNGWGESLLRYDERADTQFRVGFMALR